MNTEEKKKNSEAAEDIGSEVNLDTTITKRDMAEEAEDKTEESSEVRLEKKVTKLNDKVLRLLAENQNIRKNHEREKEDILKYGSFNFASQILSLTDNLDRAFSIFKSNEKFKDKEFLEITNGIELIEKDLLITLEKNSITYVDCLNKKFDPNFHQALSEIESEKDPGTGI